VVTAIAPCGSADRATGAVGFTTSLGFGKKLERIVREPRVALAYHAREHGFSSRPLFVLVQGTAEVDLVPSADRLAAFAPQAARHLGAIKRGPIWDRLLREYYGERVFVDVAVRRVVAWPDLDAAGAATTIGEPLAGPAPQRPPTGGTAPRVDIDKVAGQVAGLPHRVLAYRGADGFPVIVPVEFAGHDERGLRLVDAPVLPVGGRRAGILAHAYRARLVGLSTRVLTGWLDVAEDGSASYAPHTTRGFVAPPRKNLLLTVNGMMAKYGALQARRAGLVDRLRAAQSEAWLASHPQEPSPGSGAQRPPLV
jgi:hypothetical protein